MKNQKEKTIRSGLHMQLQKAGKSEKDTGEIMGDAVDDPNLSLIKLGLDLKPAEHRAVFAIQTLLHKTNYEGDLPAKVDFCDEFGFHGKLPILKFTPADFYEAFGCKKKQAGNGMKYGDNETRRAMQALKSLVEKRYFIYYRRVEFDKRNKPKYFTVKAHAPLIGKVKEEYFNPNKQGSSKTIEMDGDKIKSVAESKPRKRLSHIKMEVSPLFVDQIDTFFVQKPEGYLLEIREKYPRASEYVYNFIEYIFTQSALRKNGVIKIGKETLAVVLRMDGYIRKKKHKDINEIIEKCCRTALDLNYIKSYSIVPGKTMDECYKIVISYDRLAKVKK